MLSAVFVPRFDDVHSLVAAAAVAEASGTCFVFLSDEVSCARGGGFAPRSTLQGGSIFETVFRAAERTLILDAVGYLAFAGGAAAFTAAVDCCACFDPACLAPLGLALLAGFAGCWTGRGTGSADPDQDSNSSTGLQTVQTLEDFRQRCGAGQKYPRQLLG